jgi:ribosomal protein L7Ae-like RNA K-turn-binding protein
VDEATQRKLLGLVGLGVRGRLAVVGVEQVRAAATSGKLKIAVVAPDASRHSLDKVLPLLAARRVHVIQGPSAAELGAAVGREATAAVGVLDHQLAQGIRKAVSAAAAGSAGEDAST